MLFPHVFAWFEELHNSLWSLFSSLVVSPYFCDKSRTGWQIYSCQDSPCACEGAVSLTHLLPSSSLFIQTGLWFSTIFFWITDNSVPRVSFRTHLYLHHVDLIKVLWAMTIQTNLFLKCQAHIQDAIYWLIIKACTGTDQGLSMMSVITQPIKFDCMCWQLCVGEVLFPWWYGF